MVTRLSVFSQSLFLSPRTANHERRGSIIRSVPHPLTPKSIKQPRHAPSHRQIYSQTFLHALYTKIGSHATYGSVAHPSHLNTLGFFSLATHVDLLLSFASNFIAFHHATYQAYHMTLQQSPTHEERSGLQLVLFPVVPRRTFLCAEQPRGRVSSGRWGSA